MFFRDNLLTKSADKNIYNEEMKMYAENHLLFFL